MGRRERGSDGEGEGEEGKGRGCEVKPPVTTASVWIYFLV